MLKKLAVVLVTTVACLGFSTLASAQTCQDIHGLGSNGCAPSPLFGANVTLSGIVYVAAGTYNSGSVYFQCPGGSGGMTFFDNVAAPGSLFVGDEISVSGVVAQFGDEIQLSGASWAIVSSGNSTSATAIASGTLAAGLDLLGDLMSVQGTLTKISAAGCFNCIFEIDDGSGPVTAFVDGTTGIDIAAMDAMVGGEVEIVGATKCFGGVGEILPRFDTDITLISVAVEEGSWSNVKTIYRDE
ncbi:MAG: hypothetical protein ACE5G2_04345 [Candidatus Krumholzibacteriia bacterium]